MDRNKLVSGGVTKSAAVRFLEEIGHRAQAIGQDCGKLADIGQKMAGFLLRRGELFTPPVARWWPTEFGGRAGGLMGINNGDYAGRYEAKSSDDVAYVTLPRKWDEESSGQWKKLIEGPARVFVIGDAQEVQQRDRVEAFTGLGQPSAAEGTRPFEQFVRGWTAAGEMIAACTREGRMPHIWMSVWLEGAMVRNNAFFEHDNLREPWKVPLFHERIYIPPLEAGYVTREFLREAEKIRQVLIAQAAELAQAGRWMAEARRHGKRVSVVAVGHSYPEILEASSPLEWSKSISHVARAHPADLGEGDVALHLGYAPVDVGDVELMVSRGIRFIYTSPYGRPKALKDHPNLLWLDLPWRPGDATVDVPGYSVRILPMSSTAHTMVYFAMMAEMGA